VPRRRSLLVLDANVILELFRTGAWEQLILRYRVIVPATVLREAHFYIDPRTEERISTDLPRYVENGHIDTYEANVSELMSVKARFTPEMREGIHEGELEAIACLLASETKEMLFVSGDGKAIIATALLGQADRAACLEVVLRECGLEKTLRHEHREEYFRRHIRLGQEARVQGRGLAEQ
jgi:hypothetical protein